MFYLLTILSFLLALRLEEASASPITVMGVARSTFVVRGTTVEKIRGPFAIGGGGVSCITSKRSGKTMPLVRAIRTAKPRCRSENLAACQLFGPFVFTRTARHQESVAGD